jgi:hypothetical protein
MGLVKCRKFKSRIIMLVVIVVISVGHGREDTVQSPQQHSKGLESLDVMTPETD